MTTIPCILEFRSGRFQTYDGNHQITLISVLNRWLVILRYSEKFRYPEARDAETLQLAAQTLTGKNCDIQT
jgi:hypothetical protein